MKKKQHVNEVAPPGLWRIKPSSRWLLVPALSSGLRPEVRVQFRVLQRPLSLSLSLSVWVWQRRRGKAVGNRNTMAASLSLTQVTQSHNSNITTANLLRAVSVLPGDIPAVLAEESRADNARFPRPRCLFFGFRVVLLWLGKVSA